MATKNASTEATESKPLQNISFEWNGTVYTLEFNRSSAAFAERRYGFSLNELQSGKITYLPDLFRCALMMHHPKMKESTVDTLYELIDDKFELMWALVELYANAVNSMLEAPEGKAIGWTRH